MSFRGVFWTDLFHPHFICMICYLKAVSRGHAMWSGLDDVSISELRKEAIKAEIYEKSKTVQYCEWCGSIREAFLRAQREIQEDTDVGS